MAREACTNVNNHFLRSATGGSILSIPFTLSWWHYTTVTTNYHVFVSYCDHNSATNRNMFYSYNGYAYAALNETAINPSLAIATNSWERITVSYTSSPRTLRYRVGSSTTYENSTVYTIGSHTRWAAGVNCDSSQSSPLGSGNYMAEVALWNTDLTANEIIELHDSNVSPLIFKPESLVNYCPLIQDGDEIDWVGGRDLIETGTAAVVAHPPVIRRPRLFRAGYTGAGAAPAAPYLPYHGWEKQINDTLLRM